jgi:hypothetical protein
MSMSIDTGLNPFNFIRKHFLQICSEKNKRDRCTRFSKRHEVDGGIFERLL